LTTPLVGEQIHNAGAVPVPGGAGELAGFFKNGCPQSPLLTLPLWAVLEKVFPSLDLVLTPPAGGVRSAGGPREVLAG